MFSVCVRAGSGNQRMGGDFEEAVGLGSGSRQRRRGGVCDVKPKGLDA